MTTRMGRLLHLLDLLDGGTTWSAAHLSGLLDIPERTLRRDITELRNLGYHIEGVPGRGGHYVMPRGKRLPPQPSRSEPASERSVEMDTSAPGVADGLVILLGHAAAEHREVTFNHTGRQAKLHRTVHPARLVHLDGRWYLYGWDLDRRDWRTFRLDRIGDVAFTGNRFTPAPLPRNDVTELLREQFRSGSTLEVVLDLATGPDNAAAILHRVDGTLEATDRGRRTRYTARVDSFEWLTVVLVLTDIEFTVIRPPEFRRFVQQTSDRLHRACSVPGSEHACEDDLRDREVDDQARGVHQRGDHRGREHCRVHPDLLRHQRQHPADNAGPGTDADDGQ